MSILSRSFLIAVACFLLFVHSVLSDGTSMDLRPDGRVIAGSRISYLLGLVKYNGGELRMRTKELPALVISDRLRNMLLNSNVIAILVPSTMTEDKFRVGLLIGAETLPTDLEVDANDFNCLRWYATNNYFTTVESIFDEMNRAFFAGNNKELTSKADKLTVFLSQPNKDREWGQIFAGYVLSDFADTSEFPQFSGFVNMFRAQAERSLDPVVAESIKENVLPLGIPVRVDWSPYRKNPLIVGQLSAVRKSDITIQPSTSSTPAYFKIWYGSSLVVTAEKPGVPFNVSGTFQSWDSALEYWKKTNPNLDWLSVIPEGTPSGFKQYLK
ncbi:MAG: hypothetical protein ABSG38_12770 [Spirochaetia bacterium]|jgi:hypothetical protein